jgi:muconolactone delta-isomerase
MDHSFVEAAGLGEVAGEGVVKDVAQLGFRPESGEGFLYGVDGRAQSVDKGDAQESLYNRTPRRNWMQYQINWYERPQGSPMEYENAQKRILEVFGQWKAPANFKIQTFVIRVGEWGGSMLVETDDTLEIHKLCSMLPAFRFESYPVVPVQDAIRAELEVIAWRDGLKKQ